MPTPPACETPIPRGTDLIPPTAGNFSAPPGPLQALAPSFVPIRQAFQRINNALQRGDNTFTSFAALQDGAVVVPNANSIDFAHNFTLSNPADKRARVKFKQYVSGYDRAGLAAAVADAQDLNVDYGISIRRSAVGGVVTCNFTPFGVMVDGAGNPTEVADYLSAKLRTDNTWLSSSTGGNGQTRQMTLNHIGPAAACSSKEYSPAAALSVCGSTLNLSYNVATHDLTGHYAGSGSSCSSSASLLIYGGDGTWIDISGTNISHIGPGAACSASEYSPGLSLGYSGSTLTVSVNKGTHDRRGHFTGDGSSCSCTVTIPSGGGGTYAGDGTWIDVSGTNISHIGPGTTCTANDYNPVTTLGYCTDTGVLTLTPTLLHTDANGHRSGEDAGCSRTVTVGAPGGGTPYATLVKRYKYNSRHDSVVVVVDTNDWRKRNFGAYVRCAGAVADIPFPGTDTTQEPPGSHYGWFGWTFNTSSSDVEVARCRSQSSPGGTNQVTAVLSVFGSDSGKLKLSVSGDGATDFTAYIEIAVFAINLASSSSGDFTLIP